MKRCLACEGTWQSDGWTCPTCSWQPRERNGFLAFAPDKDEDTTAYDPDLSRLLSRSSHAPSGSGHATVSCCR
jgi:hypothetical protein